MEIRSRKIFRGWALLVTGKVYMVWREKKKSPIHHSCFSKTNDDVPEWTFPAQICEWGKFGFSSWSWLLGQTIWRTYDSLLLFLRCYPWQQVGEESIHHRLSLKQPSQGADWSSWRKKRLWPTPPVKCTPITQWKQEEEQMEGLPLPHMSKCNLYLFPFLILTPSPVGCCLATLPPCSTAALHFFSPPQPSRLHWGWEEAWPHVLPAVCRQRYCLFISTLKQAGAAQRGRWESRGHCIFWGMASSALPVSFCILTLARGGIGSQ